MRIAVLGAGSCFAVNLATHLTGRGDEVLGISRSPMRGPAFTLGLENSALFKYKAFHLVTELDRIMESLERFRPEVIVNFAALCEVGLSWKHALDYYETNLMSLVRLTNALKERSWFKKFVQIGSTEVYGSVREPVNEAYGYSPSSPYAASKAAFDYHLKAIARYVAFPGILAMPSNGYCEGQTLNRIIPKTIIAALTGKKLMLQGGGKAQKSYLHADDISRAIMLIMDKGVLGDTYNFGPDSPISIRTLVGMVALYMGKRFEEVAEITEERLGQDMVYWLDSDKIKKLGWKAEVSLTDGLGRMIHWIKSYPELLTMDTSYQHRP